MFYGLCEMKNESYHNTERYNLIELSIHITNNLKHLEYGKLEISKFSKSIYLLVKNKELTDWIEQHTDNKPLSKESILKLLYECFLTMRKESLTKHKGECFNGISCFSTLFLDVPLWIIEASKDNIVDYDKVFNRLYIKAQSIRFRNNTSTLEIWIDAQLNLDYLSINRVYGLMYHVMLDNKGAWTNNNFETYHLSGLFDNIPLDLKKERQKISEISEYIFKFSKDRGVEDWIEKHTGNRPLSSKKELFRLFLEYFLEMQKRSKNIDELRRTYLLNTLFVKVVEKMIEPLETGEIDYDSIYNFLYQEAEEMRLEDWIEHHIKCNASTFS